ncbi:DUF4153 domain-containing protein [Nafulsella turpanensis]|uniref:DUF4153 domain-containing protein n=1 Tax=Nafulsella turpanensis TaxID=1265690 RepID=UPI00034D85F5|nr:DUF4153 domain-containing protein [Nafulsella turpanensis]
MALRFPSLAYLGFQARQSFRRFPLSILSAIIAVVIGIFLVETEEQVFNRFPYINAMLCATLGISLYFCTTIFASRQQLSTGASVIVHLAATAILVGIFFTLPDAEYTQNTSLPYIRFFLYSIIIHLLVSFIPFLFTHQLNGFWNYNKALFLRFLASLLYSAFLYVGLVMALLALKTLFEVDVPDELFGELFIIIAGVFNTWFFAAGVPLDFEELDTVTSYPKGLKVFSQFVLLPLLFLYLLILYGYGIKIVLSGDWPEGIVSYMIMIVAVLGVLTMLLFHPYALHTENLWMKKVIKGYYGFLLPLLILLFLAIGMRIGDYGFTINRYFILLAGIWLTVVCCYFLTGRKNIKFIPLSLAGLLLFISIGPWGVFTISEESQVYRLEAALREGKILKAGLIEEEVKWVTDSLPEFYAPELNKNDGKLNDSLHNEVMSILDYLDNHHGFHSIQAWYQQPLDSFLTVANADTSVESWKRVSEAEIYMKTLGLPYQYKQADAVNGNYFTYRSDTKGMLDIEGYDRLLFIGQLYYQRSAYEDTDELHPMAYKRITELNGRDYTIQYNPKEPKYLTITSKTDSVHFPLGRLIRQLHERYGNEGNVSIPPAALQIDTVQGNSAYRLIIGELNFRSQKDSLTLEGATGNLLVKKLR